MNQSAAALSGSFAPAYRFENLEIRKGFLHFSSLNLEQNPSLTALAIESEIPKNQYEKLTCRSLPRLRRKKFLLFPTPAFIIIEARRCDGIGRRTGLKIYFAASYRLGGNP